MGIDFENNFDPQYITIRGRGDTVKELKKLAKKAEKVYLAADPDREGEAIAWHLSYILGLEEGDKNRVVFNEVTKDAVNDAFKTPREINQDLVDSQQARRILDRIVGYSISPLLWKKIKGGLSAGRVQSTALKLIIDRENEIRAFKPEEYWSIPTKFKKGRSSFQAQFYGENGKKDELTSEEQVKGILDKLEQDKEFKIVDIEEKERRRKPPKPYTTSTHQQDASNRINFRAGKTMMIAQQLYEGIAIGKNTIGLITYMRTDSTRISQTAKASSSNYIKEKFGQEYLGKGAAVTNSANTQDAHEAIRPSDVTLAPDDIKEYLSRDQFRLYSLIWSRFVASQMTDAVHDTIRADITQNDVNLRANGSRIKFEGFLKVYESKSKKDNVLPDLSVVVFVKLAEINSEQHFTQPPARCNEASLVKVLEELG